MRTFFFFTLALILLLPVSVEAQFGPIIPEACRTCACGFAGVLAIVQNVVNFLIAIAIMFVTIIMVWAGSLYILSATNPESRSTANKMLINAAVGLLIVLSAWLIVDFVMKTLYKNDSEFGPWNSILVGGGDNSCIVANTTPPPSLFTGNVFTVPGQPGPGAGTAGCPTCVSLTDLGLSCKSPTSCTLNRSVASAFVQLKEEFDGEWTITEAYPPTVTHSNPCHANGTCADVGFRGSTTYTVENALKFDTAIRKTGLYTVFETDNCALRDEVRRRYVQAFCKSDQGYSHITGSHFSVYPR